ncbi:CRAL-TRIO domain-containing protein [Aspergillus pseudoustus]|uniref:Phosphatidylinositol transfer protein SFH5 n=1 Tax=Aspergillus pseudoustus TaxID=1810923 RepID=A0ABR4JZI1_9EURO
MADQDKAQEQPQAAAAPAPAQEPDTTNSEVKPTTTESAPAPEPVAEPAAAAAEAAPATVTTTESATAPAPEPAAAPAPTAVPAATAEPAPTPAPEAKSEPEQAAPVPAPAPAAETAAPESTETEKKDDKPAYFTKTPALEQLFDRLPTILSTTGHSEMWGVPLKHDATDVPTINVLIKFLRANAGDLKLAEEQLTKALEWRKEYDPLTLVDAEKKSYAEAKFGGLGYLTTYEREGKGDLIVTWNIYGAVKKIDETFGDIEEFIKWRAALMELAVKELKLDQATSVIDYDGEDPYQMIQVHDYLNVSFLRLNPTIRAATKKTIEVFSTAYPELLREKFFVNVPAIMGWMFALFKVFVNENTTRKFHPISSGANLAREFPGLTEKFPKAYGGQGPELEGSARTVALTKE